MEHGLHLHEGLRMPSSSGRFGLASRPKIWEMVGKMGGSIEGTPIAGWFRIENPTNLDDN